MKPTAYEWRAEAPTPKEVQKNGRWMCRLIRPATKNNPTAAVEVFEEWLYNDVFTGEVKRMSGYFKLLGTTSEWCEIKEDE